MALASATITAANQFTSWVRLAPHSNAHDGRAYFNVTVRAAAMSATITVQYKRPGWGDAQAMDDEDGGFTAAGIRTGEVTVGPTGLLVRVGCKTGDFTSATGLVVDVEAAE